MVGVTYRGKAAKALAKLPEQVRRRIVKAINAHAETGQGDAKKLAGSGDYRLRVGDYRVIFGRDSENLDILDIGHRREIYR